MTRPFTSYHNFYLVTLTLKFDLLLQNFNLGCYLVMVAAGQASLFSDNSYYVACDYLEQLTVNVVIYAGGKLCDCVAKMLRLYM